MVDTSQDILGEGMIKHVVRKGVPINQYKQFKFIDRNGNPYYKAPENGY